MKILIKGLFNSKLVVKYGIIIIIFGIIISFLNYYRNEIYSSKNINYDDEIYRTIIFTSSSINIEKLEIDESIEKYSYDDKNGIYTVIFNNINSLSDFKKKHNKEFKELHINVENVQTFSDSIKMTIELTLNFIYFLLFIIITFCCINYIRTIKKDINLYIICGATYFKIYILLFLTIFFTEIILIYIPIVLSCFLFKIVEIEISFDFFSIIILFLSNLLLFLYFTIISTITFKSIKS